MKGKIFNRLFLMVLAVILLSSCSKAFPTKAEVAGMTEEEAKEALADKTQEEIRKNWGDPDSFYSGLYGDIYVYDDKCIGLLYDFESKKLVDVALGDRNKGLETSQDEVEEEIQGNMETYYKLKDGTWKWKDFTYKHRLEITGRIPNATEDSTFTYLSNLKDISFEEAYKAAGLSSNSEDYFSPDQALLVDME